MHKLLNRTIILALFAESCALAQQSLTVPITFQATYAQLQGYINSFQSTINASWNGSKGNTLWSADALNANCNNGLKLLSLGAAAQAEVTALKGLGVKAVTVCMAFPILDQDFYTFNGDPGDYASILAFYQAEAAAIHGAGLKMIVEAHAVQPGTSGMNVTGYYNSLSDAQYIAGRQQNALTIAQMIQPDYINLNTEPQTDLLNTGKTNEYGNPTGYTAMNQSIISGLHAAGVTIPLGCGVDTWESDPTWVSDTLAISGLDFFDLHSYPVNLNLYLPRLITYADMAIAANIPVGISEAWELKESDTEWSNQTLPVFAVYARDPYSFWAPMDQAMLTALVDFSNWKGLVYMSAFWSRYFWSYLDYNQEANVPYETVISDSEEAAAAALASHQVTGTAIAYRNLIVGGAQASTVSAASFALGDLAPDSMVTIFGNNLSTGTASAQSLPLPTTLSNTSATIADSSGNEQPVLLIYVSPGQINAVLPSGLANGPAVITIFSQGTAVAQSNFTLYTVAPAIYTANQNGKGAPVGVVVTAQPDGTQTTAYTFQGTAAGNYIPEPINLGAPQDSSALVLYGTGIRGRSSLANVTVTIGTLTLPVQYAGPCDPAQFVGFDQVNVNLPYSLAGAGQVTLTLTVDGIAAPPVTLDFQ